MVLLLFLLIASYSVTLSMDLLKTHENIRLTLCCNNFRKIEDHRLEPIYLAHNNFMRYIPDEYIAIIFKGSTPKDTPAAKELYKTESLHLCEAKQFLLHNILNPLELLSLQHPQETILKNLIENSKCVAFFLEREINMKDQLSKPEIYKDHHKEEYKKIMSAQHLIPGIIAFINQNIGILTVYKLPLQARESNNLN